MITFEELKIIADLAKLAPDEAELAELNALATFAGKIAGADLSGADLSEPDDLVPLREDVVMPSTPQSVILGGAPDAAYGMFVARGMGGAK